MNRWFATLALVALLASCATAKDEGRGAAGVGTGDCGTEVEEALDPGSTQHLLPGAPEPAYPNVAPTSGPHLGAGTPVGAQDRPLPRPVQVGVLEQGRVLVQYRPDRPEARRQLEALAGERVVVAPNPALPSPVVATAWLHRLECRTADLGARDLEALRTFISRHGTGRPVG
jgi:Protein of unknown function (DUF3105)